MEVIDPQTHKSKRIAALNLFDQALKQNGPGTRVVLVENALNEPTELANGQQLADSVLTQPTDTAADLVKMMEAGTLGKKTGQGYFEWPNGERPKIDFSKATNRFNFLWPFFVQINEATKLIQEGVVDSLNDVDLALINSSGMPFGPIGLGRQISRLDLIDNLEMLAERYDKPMFKPTRRVLEGGHKF